MFCEYIGEQPSLEPGFIANARKMYLEPEARFILTGLRQRWFWSVRENPIIRVSDRLTHRSKSDITK